MPESKPVYPTEFLEKASFSDQQLSEKDWYYQNPRQFLELLELMPVMWMVGDADSGKILYFNQELANKLQYSVQELEQMALYDLYGRDKEDQVENLIIQLKKDGRTFGMDNVLCRRDYSPIEVIINARLIMGEGKEKDWILIVFHNITDYKRAAKLNQILENRVKKRTQELTLELENLKKEYQKYKRIDLLTNELKRSRNDLEQFAYITSHDLQEPIRMIISYLQLLERRAGPKLKGSEKEFLNFAVDGASRMKELLDGILEYSRINTRGIPFEISSLSEMMDQVKRNLRWEISDSEAVIEYENLPEIKVDRGQVIKLLQNLIDNSIKFCDNKPPQIRIEYTELKTHHQIRLTDNGIGINPDYLDRIFLIFQRLNRRGEYVGNGIGLAVCRGIVQRHGGKIWVESEEGKGASFVFTVKK